MFLHSFWVPSFTTVRCCRPH